MDWTRLTRTFQGPGVYFVYDELNRNREREKLCALRKYPALYRLGFDRLTCPKSWQKVDQWSTNQFEFEETEFTHMDDVPQSPVADLAAITDQYYEDKLPLFSLSQIINWYSRSDARIVVGADERNFETAGAPRPLREMDFLGGRFSYRELFEAFDDQYQSLGYELPLDHCMNVFVQENALLYEQVSGESVSTIQEFFDILPKAPYLPIWRSLGEIFTVDEAQGTRLLDAEQRTEFAKWLRRRVELDYHEGQETAAYLTNLARRRERLFDPYARVVLAEMDEAYNYLDEIEAARRSDPVTKRLAGWIRESLTVDKAGTRR